MYEVSLQKMIVSLLLLASALATSSQYHQETKKVETDAQKAFQKRIRLMMNRCLLYEAQIAEGRIVPGSDYDCLSYIFNSDYFWL